jgi:hemerythrin superfamily protein
MARGTDLMGKALGKVKGAKQALTGGAGIFQRLAEEHGEISTMIRRVAASTHGSPVRAELFPRIKEELLAHAKAEEKEVYPVFRSLPEMEHLIGDAVNEHGKVDRMLRELSAMSYSDDRWIVIFRELMSEVQHHVLDEEQKVFPKAKRAMTREQSEELEGRFLRTKEGLVGSLE